jgi:hypothetical protein
MYIFKMLYDGIYEDKDIQSLWVVSARWDAIPWQESRPLESQVRGCLFQQAVRCRLGRTSYFLRNLKLEGLLMAVLVYANQFVFNGNPSASK